ncbi:MAG: hypothetical protein A2X97_08670 [Bdellovibrionales bacterium GWA1_52_35]|nr:MAG: hypothetical protein A2X97_08670 [Bdellovibrionales bacterium GWA1_52_35]HCM41196.1 7-carboxy-7-deazaguanine synthase QueE [Bdellovibrionales bacterium]
MPRSHESDSPELIITEIFHSLQGESTLAGLRFGFIRLTGCNLRCTYCDSEYAFTGGQKFSIEKILAEIRSYDVKNVLITGGEPLLQKNTPSLVMALKKDGYAVSIETHGETSIAPVAGLARIIMDIKTPSSGMSCGGFRENLNLLKPTDEVKFVVASPEDYDWAKAVVRENMIPTQEILFSPALPVSGKSEKFKGVQAQWLAEKILTDQLPVRFQLQLHKLIWGPERTGV